MKKDKRHRKEEMVIFWKKAKEEIRNRKGVFALYLLLRLSVVLIMIAQFFNRNYENVFLCLLTLMLFVVPSFLERKLRIRIPDTMEIIILLFIYAAEIMGEIHSVYTLIPMWDTMLHTMNGFLEAAIGFCLVDLLNRNEKFSFVLSPTYLAIVAFCFSMTIGVLWEFFEFGMDHLFHMDMQKDTVLEEISSVTLNPDGLNHVVVIDGIESVTVHTKDGDVELPTKGYLDVGIYDTMADLFVNFIGAVVFSIIGYFYVKSNGTDKKGRLAKRFIPEVYQDDE